MNKLDLVIPKVILGGVASAKIASPFATVLTNFAQDYQNNFCSRESHTQNLWRLDSGCVELISHDWNLNLQKKIHLISSVYLRAMFHIAPANVDTLFVYSWMLALLVGNKNFYDFPHKTLHNLIYYWLPLVDYLMKIGMWRSVNAIC